jgi:hypothetical protein
MGKGNMERKSTIQGNNMKMKGRNIELILLKLVQVGGLG